MERCCRGWKQRACASGPDPAGSWPCGVEVVRRIASPTSEVLQKRRQVSAANSGKTKHDRILGMLRTRGGATIATIARVTGWQSHSVRGFLAGVVKKKLGLKLASETTSSDRVYRIVEVKPPVSPRKAQLNLEQPHA
jgi:uncharacterized protein DUF3489